MVELIRNIPIEHFLVPFGGIVIASLAICCLWANTERSLDYLLPTYKRFDPVAVAALRGGWKSVVQLAVYFLWRYHLVDIIPTETGYEIVYHPGKKHKNTNHSGNHAPPFGAIGEEIVRFLQTPRKTMELNLNLNFRNTIEKLLQPVYVELEKEHLKRTGKDRLRIRSALLVHTLVTGVIGGIKLYFEIDRNRSIVALTAILFFSFLLSTILLNPMARPTRLGFRFIRVLENYFTGKLDVIKKARDPEGDMNSPMAIAVYGIDPFWIPSDYYRAFREDNHGSSGRWRERKIKQGVSEFR